jgi:hypothetical protein
MQNDQGIILQKAVLKSGISISEIGRRMGKGRSWLYFQFSRNKIPVEVFFQIGKIISHDFTEDVAELRKFSPIVAPNNEEENVDYWKMKYFKLLEEHVELLKRQR